MIQGPEVLGLLGGAVGGAGILVSVARCARKRVSRKRVARGGRGHASIGTRIRNVIRTRWKPWMS